MLKKSTSRASRSAGQRGRRDLDHDPDRRQADAPLTAAPRARPPPRPPPPCASRSSPSARDEREHDSQPPVARGAQQRAQLRLEHLAAVEAQPDRAQAEWPAGPDRGRPIGGPAPRRSQGRPGLQLLLVDVERAHGDRARAPCPRPARGTPRYCWSSPIVSGEAVASRNSDRNRPMPSAPASRAACTSPGSSMFASRRSARRRRSPRRPVRRDARRGGPRAARPGGRARATSSGGGVDDQLAGRAVDHDRRAGGDFAAGRAEADARRARRATARGSPCGRSGCRCRSRSRGSCVQSTCAASEGVSSSATSTTPALDVAEQVDAAAARPRAGSSAGGRRRRRRPPCARRRYASSIPSKTPASSSKARWTAHSALTRSLPTRCRTRSTSIGSSSISSCASNR